MKRRSVYSCLLFYLYFISAFTHSKAQTITTGTIAPSSICAGTGGTVTVPFTTSGAFASSNTFSAQLSDASGVFPANPTVIGTSRTTSPISGTISSTLAAGSNYRIRVVSSNRAVVGTTSTNALLVNPLPAAPAVTTAPPYCEDDPNPALLVATPSAGGTLNWYGTNPNGPGNPSLARPNTSDAGSSTYYVSQTVNGCESKPRTPIPVLVRAKPAAPGVSPVNYCTGQTATALSATPSTGGTLNWYGTSPTSGTALSTGPIPTVNATYYVSQTVNGCESARASLVVTFTPSPTAPLATAPGPYCEGTTAPSLTAAGQNLRWYGSATGGTSSTLATVPSTTVVGTTTYYVSQIVNGCEGPRTAIPVLVKDTPDKPGTTAVSFCQGTPPPALTAALVANATPNWYGTNAAGGSASGTAPILSGSSVGSTTYYVSQKLDGCESLRASLNVRVKETPGAPGVSRTSFCNNRPAQPLSASGSNIKWFNAAGNALSGAPTPVTNAVGDQVFKASQTSNEGCEGPKADLVVTIKPLPGLPSVANVSFCQAQTDQPAQNVSALSANGQNLRWYNLNGDALSNAPTPAIDRTGVQSYQVSQTVNECEGDRATLQVTVRTTAAPAVTRPLVMYCINAQATPLQATIEPGASARWLDPYGRITNDAPTPSTLNTNVDPAGDRFFVYQIGSNGCYSPRSAIRVIVNTTPTLSLAAPISNVNLGLKVPLKLTFTGSAPYSYTITGGYTGTSLTNDTTITVLPRGNTTYQVNAVRNGCGIGLPGNPATAVVTVRIPTVATGAVTNSTLCVGTSLTVPFTTTGQFNPGNTFRYELVSLADSTKKYDIPATANASPVTAILPLTILSGQYSVRVKALNPEVGVTGTNSPTPVTIRSLPSAALTGSQAIYEGTPANLTIAFGGDGPWTVTYADSIRSYSAVTTVNPYVAEIRPARTTAYRITSVTNSCGSGTRSGTATVSVLPLLGVEDNSLDPLVTVHPVPTSTVLTVELDLPLLRDPAEISLLTIQGRSVLQHSTRSRRTDLDLSAQPNGLYILRIQVGDRYTVRKVIKL